MQSGDRVARASDPDVVGIIIDIERDMATVAWPHGPSSQVRLGNLVRVPVQDKSWPPSGMERKTPDAETK